MWPSETSNSTLGLRLKTENSLLSKETGGSGYSILLGIRQLPQCTQQIHAEQKGYVAC